MKYEKTGSLVTSVTFAVIALCLQISEESTLLLHLSISLFVLVGLVILIFHLLNLWNIIYANITLSWNWIWMRLYAKEETEEEVIGDVADHGIKEYGKKEEEDMTQIKEMLRALIHDSDSTGTATSLRQPTEPG